MKMRPTDADVAWSVRLLDTNVSHTDTVAPINRCSVSSNSNATILTVAITSVWPGGLPLTQTAMVRPPVADPSVFPYKLTRVSEHRHTDRTTCVAGWLEQSLTPHSTQYRSFRRRSKGGVAKARIYAPWRACVRCGPEIIIVHNTWTV